MIKSIFTFFLGVLLSVNLVFAQFALPKITPAKEGHAKIKGTFEPEKDFLKMFPNFLNDGIYFFDYESILYGNAGRQDQDRDDYSGLFSFNSNEYPADEVQSAKGLAGLGKVMVQLVADSSPNLVARGFNLGNTYYTNKEFSMESYTDIDRYNSLIGYVKNTDEKYEEIDNSYKKSAQAILKKKQADSFSINRVGTLVFDNSSYTNANFTLQFVFVQSDIWLSKKVSAKFPSHALYKLIVKDISGEIVNTYGQAIFFDGFGANLSGSFVMRETFPIAMESLINRFLNDKNATETIATMINEEKTVRKQIQHYDSLYTYKRAYDVIRAKKHQLLFDLACLYSRYVDIEKSNKEREKAISNRDRSLDNNILTSTMVGVGYGNWARGLRRGIERSQQKLSILNQIAMSISMEETKFSKDVQLLFTNPFDQSFIFDSREYENNLLNQMLGKLSNKKDETFSSIQTTSRSVDKDFGTMYTNNLNSFFKGLNSIGTSVVPPEVETTAIKNGGNAGTKNMEVCQQQATAAWYKSQEYNTYMKTKLHADASDCKAKSIELTLQYCEDKLPPNEIPMFRQAAANERRVARELRAAAKNSVHF